MEALRARKWWVGTCGSVLAITLLFLSGCASMPFAPAPQPQAAASLPAADDDDWTQLNAQLRADLSRYTSREIVRKPTIAPSTATSSSRDREFATRAQALFAPRGTEVVAVTDGIVSYIGDQKLGGHCIWLTTENGASFYYAHLDRWAPGLYEGMEVQAGDLVGFVGNTGNAKYTPSHLHFGVNSSDEMVNPFPLLTSAVTVARAHQHVELGGGVGTR